MLPLLCGEQSRGAGEGGSAVPCSLALPLDPQTSCCLCREMPFVRGREQLCASRARPWALLMWPQGRALPHVLGTAALCAGRAGQGCPVSLRGSGCRRMCRTRAPVCVHPLLGQGGMGGFRTPAAFSSPLLSHTPSPCSWHFQDALEAAVSSSGHWGLSKDALRPGSRGPALLRRCPGAQTGRPRSKAQGWDWEDGGMAVLVW